MSEDTFSKRYNDLNIEQKRAVDAIEGPVMVIAGPGTGKTSILTLRIANILRKTDTPANGILALTFTESGVHSMRRKLVEYLGSQAYRVHIYTFHGFAQEIISRYPEYFPRIIGGVIVSDSERYRILEEALFEGDYEIIRPFGKPSLYVRKALSAIQDLKRDGVSPEEFLSLLKEEEGEILSRDDLKHDKGRFKGNMKREYVDLLRNNAKNRELVALFAEYEKSLAKNNFYDYEDMLLELVRALKENSDLLLSLQEEYLYILADEHQDANNSQNAILELISDYRDTRNLFIVGDEKQAIYRFQGASLENFLYFQNKYPDAQVIFLDSNYRSTQNILDASHKLMVTDGSDIKLRPRLNSSRKVFENRPITLISFTTIEDEMEGIAENIKQTIESGVPAEEIAVLVRTNAETSLVGRALQGFSVQHTIFADDNVLKDPDIAKLLILFRAVVHPEEDVLIGKILFIDFLGLNPIDAVKINRTASERRVSPLDLLSVDGLIPGLNNPVAVKNLLSLFTNWMVRANNESVIDSFISIVSDTKFQEYLLNKQESIEKVEKLSKLYDEVKSFLTTHKDASLLDFMDSIDTLLRHGGVISFSRRILGARGVAVMTAHKSKGLEWQKVYIVNAGDKVWGNRRSIGGFKLPPPLGSEDNEGNEDERRLFYVALTRAKEHVVISFSNIDANGKDRLVSQFVEDLPNDLLEKIEGNVFGGGDRLNRAQIEKKSDIRTIFDKEYLKEIFLDQGLNATALNNYFECPWKYFFKNLVRLPDVPAPYLHFGNATHSALKALADARREGRKFTEKDFVKVFREDLTGRPISKRDLAEAIKKGNKYLPVYFKERISNWHNDAFTEYPIVGVSILIENNINILLRGRLDKLELLGGNMVNVVDYKTGGYKTRNEILGQTRNSDGNIKRQLDFYRLLLELHDGGKYEMIKGTIDFIEPDEKGKIHTEVFEMNHNDAENVKKEVERIATEIINFSFWDKECADAKCDFCNLKRTLFS